MQLVRLVWFKRNQLLSIWRSIFLHHNNVLEGLQILQVVKTKTRIVKKSSISRERWTLKLWLERRKESEFLSVINWGYVSTEYLKLCSYFLVTIIIRPLYLFFKGFISIRLLIYESLIFLWLLFNLNKQQEPLSLLRLNQ